MTAAAGTGRPQAALPSALADAEALAELVHDLGDLYDFDAGGGWWWAVLRAAPGYVIKAQCPRELRAMVEEDHEARVGRRVP